MRGSDSTPVESDPRQDKARLVDPDPRHASPRSRQRASGDASSTDYEIDESLAAHASRRSRRSLLSMRLLCFNKLDLILRRPPTGRANARPMTGSVAVSKDGLQYRFVIPGTRYIRGAASTPPNSGLSSRLATQPLRTNSRAIHRSEPDGGTGGSAVASRVVP